MTVETVEGGSVAPYVAPADEFDAGLEDIDSSDLVIPRLNIVHADGVFTDNLTNQRYEVLDLIALGLVKQRVMWDDDVEDGDKPQCKSPDFEHGFPQMREDIPKDKQFPWAKSNFDRTNAVPIEVGPSAAWPEGYSSNGLPTLPCASCIFKEWDKGDWKQPPCSEQHTYMVLFQPEEGVWSPALLTFQKTGMKPSKSYISYFGQTKTPMFQVYTQITLTQHSRGTVKYCVPNFKRGGATPREHWSEYAQQARAIRGFIRQAPRRFDEDESTVTPTAASVPAAAAPPAAPATAPPAAPAAPAPAPAAAPAPPAAPAPAAPVAEAPAAPAADASDDLPF